MNEFSIPDLIDRVRTNYETYSTRWLGAGAAIVVMIIIALLVVPGYFSEQSEARENLTKGLIALNREEYVGALQIFEKMERSQRRASVTRLAPLYKGAALFGLERMDQAEMAYREFLTTNPKDYLAPQAMMGIAACQEEKGDAKAALATYREAQTNYPGSFVDDAIALQVARLASQLGDPETARAIYDDLGADSEGLWRELVRGRRNRIAHEMETAADTAAS